MTTKSQMAPNPEPHTTPPAAGDGGDALDARLDPNAAQAVVWVAPNTLRDHAMPPADVVLVDRLLEWSAAQ